MGDCGMDLVHKLPVDLEILDFYTELCGHALKDACDVLCQVLSPRISAQLFDSVIVVGPDAGTKSILLRSKATAMSDIITTTTHGESEKFEKTRHLPEEVVERIISRIPFPFLFKARLLSRAWYFKFPLKCQLIRSVWPSLQNHISSISCTKWPTYCPIYMSHEALLGFDRASSRWQTVMNIARFPDSTWSDVTCESLWRAVMNIPDSTSTDITCEGPLICFLTSNRHRRKMDVYITNSITKCWRRLDFQLCFGKQLALKIILLGSHAYQVLIVLHNRTGLCSYVYDSRTRTYKTNSSFGEVWVDLVQDYIPDAYPASAYLDGKVYCAFSNEGSLWPVSWWIYNVANNTWSTFPKPPLNSQYSDCGVLRCGEKIMVAKWNIRDPDEEYYQESYFADHDHGIFIAEESIDIYELDVVTLEVELVTSGPPEVTYGVGVREGRMSISSDSNFIYFGGNVPGIAVLSYNVEDDEWDCIPPACYNLKSMGEKKWTTGAFRPGLCPFIMV